MFYNKLLENINLMYHYKSRLSEGVSLKTLVSLIRKNGLVKGKNEFTEFLQQLYEMMGMKKLRLLRWTKKELADRKGKENE